MRSAATTTAAYSDTAPDPSPPGAGPNSNMETVNLENVRTLRPCTPCTCARRLRRRGRYSCIHLLTHVEADANARSDASIRPNADAHSNAGFHIHAYAHSDSSAQSKTFANPYGNGYPGFYPRAAD